MTQPIDVSNGARPGDIVVLTPTDIEGVWARVQAYAKGPAPRWAAQPAMMDMAHG